MSLSIKSFFFLVIVAVSAATIYLLLPLLKEGWPTDRSALIVAIALLLVALLLAWRRLGVREVAPRSMYSVGMVLLALPLALYAFIGSAMLFYQSRAYFFAKNTRIVSYRSTALHWPGFARPVGARIEIDLEVPFAIGGSFLPPKIVLANAREDSADPALVTYLRRCTAADGANACMAAPLWPYRAPTTLTDGKTVHLAYELVPSNIGFLQSSNHVCVSKPGTERSDGNTDVRALWLYASDGGVIIDLGSALTREILRDHAVDWTGMMRGEMRVAINSETLTRAGYQSCQTTTYDASESDCYCRSSKP